VLMGYLVDCLVAMMKSDSLDLKERTADVFGHASPKLTERLRNEVALK
jgi:hypothetical protein